MTNVHLADRKVIPSGRHATVLGDGIAISDMT